MENIIQNSIAIPKKFTNYIEKLSFEVSARLNLITFMLLDNIDNIEMFKKIQSEYQEFFIQFQLAKSLLEETYIKPNFKNILSWELDYELSEVIIYG